jgi:hypothetical protein
MRQTEQSVSEYTPSVQEKTLSEICLNQISSIAVNML